MSFRELRNFTEIMRALGYTRLISMENFRTPNFELVADILHWLTKRYDPSINVPYNISTEEGRVNFIRTVAQEVAMKARIKLNAKKLYGADGYAVKELLKLATLLHKSLRETPQDQTVHETLPDINFSNRITDLRVSRELASQLTSLGASIYSLLEDEVDLREARQRSIARPLDMDEIQRSVQKQISNIQERIRDLNSKIEHLTQDEQSLATKIENKKTELQRKKSRLESFQNVRPAFMDEYERLEVQLRALHKDFLERYRNLEYLEAALEEETKKQQQEAEQTEAALRRVQSKYREEELNTLRGESPTERQTLMQDEEEEAQEVFVEKPRANKVRENDFGEERRAHGERKAGKVMGSLTGGDVESETEDSLSNNTGSEEVDASEDDADNLMEDDADGLVDDDDAF